MTSGSPPALSWAPGELEPGAPPSICCLAEGSDNSSRPQRQAKERGRSFQMLPPTMGSFAPGRSHFKGQRPGRRCAEYSHDGLSVAGTTGWQPWEPLPPGSIALYQPSLKCPAPYCWAGQLSSLGSKPLRSPHLFWVRYLVKMSALGRPSAGVRACLAQPSSPVQELLPEVCGSSFNISIR